MMTGQAVAERDDRQQTAIRLPPELRLKLGYLGLQRRLSLNDMIIAGMVDWYNRQPEAKGIGTIDPALAAPVKRGPRKQEEPAPEPEPKPPAKPPARKPRKPQ